MAVISQKIPNLIGGVSQQPDSLKLPGQLRECTNFLPDTTLGLVKRPGTKGIGQLANSTADGTWFPMFLSDEDRFVVQVAKNGTVRIWDADTGVAQPVNTISAGALAYGVHTDQSQLDLLQINNFIFLLNRSKVTARGAAKSAVINPSGYVLINSVGYESTYNVTVDSTTFTHTTASSGTLSLTDVRDALTAAIDADAAYVAVAVGNAIKVSRADNADFKLTADGGGSGQALEAYKGIIPSIVQLPRQYFNGDKIKIEVPGSGAPGYWLEFQTADGGASGSGVWVETIAPDTFLNFAPATAPHVIIQEANGTFTYRQFGATEAAATAQSASVTGTASGVTVTNPGVGSYAVGQTFGVTGGTGINLRLRVTRTRTDTTTTTSTLPSNTRVVWNVFADKSEYSWFVSSTEIARTSTSAPVVLGNTTYSVGGAFVAIPGPTPPILQSFEAPLTAVTVQSGIIDQVEPSRVGRAYTATNVVTNLDGATFTVNTVATITQEVIPFAKQSWVDRKVGDVESNADPSFVGSTVSGMSFYQNRLILMSGESIVCSKAGDFFNFFADSVATFVDSDPIDISCGSRTPVQLRFGISTNQGLFLFSDSAQYVLNTSTDAFSASSAELNQISSYPESFRVGPVDTGSTFIFLEENDRSSMVFEMAPGDARQSRTDAVDLTRLIPTYIPADIQEFKSSQSSNLLAMRSSRSPKDVSLFRFSNRGTDRVMSSWFKWTMPANVQGMFFLHETMYIVLRDPSASSSIMVRLNLISDSPSGGLVFEDKVFDVRLDAFDYNPTRTYSSGTDTTRVDFKPGLFLAGAQPVVVTISPENPGTTLEPVIQQDMAGYFVELPGDLSTTRLALGLKYESSALLPNFYYRRGEGSQSDTTNIPTLNRIQIDTFESGPFKVKVESIGRASFELEIPQRKAGITNANTLPMLRTGKNTFPVMARGDLTDITFIADSPFPTSMNSLVWEGTYNTKGVRVL
jgi:hypothetical protein